MNKLKVWQKLTAMGAVLMLPFGVVTYKMTASINTLGTEFARQEIRGLEYYSPALALLKDLQRHRGTASAWLSGDASFKRPFTATRTDIDNDIRKVDEIDRRLGAALHTTEKWTALRAACAELLNEEPGLSASESFEQHTKVIADTIAFIKDIGDTSNLTLDPDIDSYYLMNIVIFQAPALSELIAQARGLGAIVINSGSRTPEQLARFNELSTLAAFVQESVADNGQKALTFNPLLVPQLGRDLSSNADAVRQAAANVATLSDTRRAAMSASDYYDALTRSVESTFAMEARVAASLNELLHSRVTRFRLEVAQTLAWAGAGLLVVSLIGFVITRHITRTLKGAVALVAEVQRSGIQVNASVNEIAATAKQQQATATAIAATTTEIGATSREISATSKELVRTMSEVSDGAVQSAMLAGNGQAGLARMEDTMRQVMDAAGSINAKLAVLNQKAGNITQVVTTITKVADQTNLLSLNAAIEAENAGEYGRGFAVVATEIRRLADQTAVATYDIEQMVKEIQSAVAAGVMGMDKFSEEVRRGMQDVTEVGSHLSQIIQQVQALAPRVEAVNEGMQAQATGAEKITSGLTQLTEAAQQTVESLHQSNTVIDGLTQAATQLRSGVARFTLAA
jgi:methyl-accepting chemotaxis protein